MKINLRKVKRAKDMFYNEVKVSFGNQLQSESSLEAMIPNEFGVCFKILHCILYMYIVSVFSGFLFTLYCILGDLPISNQGL